MPLKSIQIKSIPRNKLVNAVACIPLCACTCVCLCVCRRMKMCAGVVVFCVREGDNVCKVVKVQLN